MIGKAGLLVVVCTALGCAAARSTRTGVEWEPVVVWQGDAAFERVRTGRPDAADPSLQIVGVDQAGAVVHVHYDGGTPRATVVHRNPGELTGLLVDDVDPSVAGEEIYVGGHLAGETGGVVVQVVLGTPEPRTRPLWTGDAYVHSIERVPGEPGRLLVCTYAGEVHLLTATPGDGPWADRTLFRDAPAKDVETPKIKDAAFVRDPGAAAAHEALIAFKTGRLLLLDVDRPETARILHDEPGGLSRVTAEAEGGAYVTGYQGRLLHFVRDGTGFRFDVVDQEGVDSGLRGCVLGDFPLPQGGTAHLAIFGFHRLCRALTPRLGAWDPTTLYRDVERGHTIEAADLVPGNDADEIVLGGYSKRLVVLVARRTR